MSSRGELKMVTQVEYGDLPIRITKTISISIVWFIEPHVRQYNFLFYAYIRNSCLKLSQTLALTTVLSVSFLQLRLSARHYVHLSYKVWLQVNLQIVLVCFFSFFFLAELKCTLEKKKRKRNIRKDIRKNTKGFGEHSFARYLWPESPFKCCK